MRTALLALLLAASASAQSTVIYGNLGNAGTGALSATNTDIGSDYSMIGMSFNTPADQANPLIDSITLGLFFDNLLTSQVSIQIQKTNFAPTGFNENETEIGIVPEPTSSYTSNSTVVGSGGKYLFTFPTPVVLENSSSYTVLVSSGVSWYAAASFANPIGRNLSGLTRSNTFGFNVLDNEWQTMSFPYSISIKGLPAPIPEPSTYGLILGGLALAGAAIRRRKQSAK